MSEACEIITKKEFVEHCKQNEKAFGEVIPVIKALAPLADPSLIATLKESAEFSNATKKVSGRITRNAKTLAVYLGVIATILLIVKSSRDFILELLIKLR